VRSDRSPLAVAALAQTLDFALSGSIALLADLTHNLGDAWQRYRSGPPPSCAPTQRNGRAGLFRRRGSLHQRLRRRGRGDHAPHQRNRRSLGPN